jgi:nitrogenase subunit NifH
MKKINLSQFRKKDEESFEIVRKALTSTFFETNVVRNSTIKLNTLINFIPESEAKKKFVNFSNGFDFAVIDVL